MLMTIAEAIEYLKLSRTTLHHLVCEGRLSVVRIGGRVLFDKGDLEGFINACKTPENDEEPKG